MSAGHLHRRSATVETRTTQMKLLYITNGITGAAGLERVLSIKASYLADQLGYTVKIVSLNEDVSRRFYDFSDKIAFEPIRVGGNPLAYFSAYRSGLQAVVDAFQPDLISVCDDGLKAFLLPRLLKSRAKIIYERHVSKDIAIAGKSGLRLLAAKWQLKLMNLLGNSFDAFVVLTQGNRREWPLKNLHVIPNPLPFYPDKAAALTQKTVLAVGRQSYQKGYDLLLEVWKELAPQHPDWQLHIVGKSNPALALPEQAARLGISDSVRFFEPDKHIESRYLNASVYVMSSRFEGFGMVLIEAMACGVPCVSFDCPHGPSDIISHDTDGLLVPNGDKSALAASLQKLMTDDALRFAQGASARENVKRFSIEHIAPVWDNLFKSLIR